jgi:predicted nucleotidyltransferase
MSTSRIEALVEERKGRRLAEASTRALATLTALEAAGLSAWVVGSLARRTFSIHSDVDFLVDCAPDAESAAFRIVEREMGDFPFHFISARELDEAKKATMMEVAVGSSGIRAYSKTAD